VNDGVTDGVITVPAGCCYNPYTLAGESTPCGTITTQDAAVVAKDFEGPATASGRRVRT
jgi:hypothetical protein